MPRPSRLTMVLVLAALALFSAVLIGSAYFTTTPGFFARFEDLSVKHAQWATSTHAEVACAGCHALPGVRGQVSFRARMVGELYRSFVVSARGSGGFAPPANASCRSCHTDLRAVSPLGDLQIPHRAHITTLKMRCVECHNYLVHGKSPTGKNTPTMAGCMRCHDGKTAKNGCVACHTKKAVPASHRAKDWAIVHAAKATDPDCHSCHKWTDDWCAECHRRRPGSHGVDWRAVHGLQVQEHRSCEACHTGPFCIRCHGRVPPLNFDPALKLVR